MLDIFCCAKLWKFYGKNHILKSSKKDPTTKLVVRNGEGNKGQF